MSPKHLRVRTPGPWRRGMSLAIILGVLAVLAVVGAPVTDELTKGLESLDDPASASARAKTAITEATGTRPEGNLLALVALPEGVTAPNSLALLGQIEQQLREEEVVASVATPRTEAFLAGRDGHSAVVAVTFRALPDRQVRDGAQRIAGELARRPGVRVSGLTLVETTMTEQIERDLRTGELVAFPLLFLLSVWVFRSLLAALLPLVVGGAGIVATMAALRAVNSVVGLSVYVTNLVIALTLGLAIDYTLFFINRYREELARDDDPAGAVRATLRTTGRTIVFSAVMVAVALGSLLVFPQRFVYSMGVAGALAPLLAAACALLILPPALLLVGRRIDSFAPRWLRRAASRDSRSDAGGAWYRLAYAVMRRPVAVAAVASVLLLGLGLPVVGLRVTGFTPYQLPASSPARTDYDEIARAAPATATARFYLVAATGDGALLAGYSRALAALPHVSLVTVPHRLTPASWRLDVITDAPDLSEQARTVVDAVRLLPAPVPILVGGLTPAFVDELASLGDHLPLALSMLGLSMVLILFVFTRSVLLPLKTLVMNLLTVAAFVGLLVVVFQWAGLGQPPDAVTALEVSTLLVTVVAAFGLATDYGVFVLSRIAEAHQAGASNEEAVAGGLERTGRLVTAAALLFSVAVGAFVTSQLVFVKELSVGLVAAVLLDATVVRALLVPALMRLLGDANWWAPPWARRFTTRGRRRRRRGDPASQLLRGDLTDTRV